MDLTILLIVLSLGTCFVCYLAIRKHMHTMQLIKENEQHMEDITATLIKITKQLEEGTWK